MDELLLGFLFEKSHPLSHQLLIQLNVRPVHGLLHNRYTKIPRFCVLGPEREASPARGRRKTRDNHRHRRVGPSISVAVQADPRAEARSWGKSVFVLVSVRRCREIVGDVTIRDDEQWPSVTGYLSQRAKQSSDV